MIHFHKWSRWITAEQGETFLRKFDGRGWVRYPSGRFLIQTRECSVCGLKQIVKDSI